MEMTDLFAAIVDSAVKPGKDEVVTSMLVKPRIASGPPTIGMHIPDYVSYACLGVEQSESDLTATRLLSPHQLLPLWQALRMGTRDIHTNGGPAISVFANGVWRLLIASRTISMPRLSDGGSFESVHSVPMIVLLAKLFAQQALKLATKSNAMNAWHVVVPAADEGAISSFLFTALELSQRATSGRSVESL